ncbi:hypothetical protein [Thalassotalea hakodatensis]|uniref:hypothetical protein n=1 Tax=Thalassotalea hakodatensis TaxID=3030492 RepID=UPI002572C885|nr:hypothetical protein [Thalassotalea hakodatensis]
MVEIAVLQNNKKVFIILIIFLLVALGFIYTDKTFSSYISNMSPKTQYRMTILKNGSDEFVKAGTLGDFYFCLKNGGDSTKVSGAKNEVKLWLSDKMFFNLSVKSSIASRVSIKEVRGEKYKSLTWVNSIGCEMSLLN